MKKIYLMMALVALVPALGSVAIYPVNACCCGADKIVYIQEEKVAMADESTPVQTAPANITSSATSTNAPATAEEVSPRADSEITIDKSKLSAPLKMRIAQDPLGANNGQKPLRITVLTNDRGCEVRTFCADNGGKFGSVHGHIVSVTIPYQALPAMSRLASVKRLEGETYVYTK